ncbi:fic family toxin-antitoxin system, toxin component [Actinacidiphila glaucinigra]|uniref:fic family toxin-antitoxin system, toxin component n=1 Tax=Actinacidiphila glaucinigra TaxID=235986 RepID=UPI0033B65111
MSNEQPDHLHLEVPWLLQLAEQITGDPQANDFGPLFAAVSRHSAVAMGRDVYGSLWLKAGALLETLSRLRTLEHSNRQFALMAAIAFLQVNGHSVNFPPKEAAILVRDVAEGDKSVVDAARALRDWAAT